ncbi:MAG: hypothetical protein JHC61_10450 [Burkholderiaceae bacterium]|nr:hypothetical protein [Burkholderiaceae bacterium]
MSPYRATALEAGVIAPNWHWIESPLAFDSFELDLLTRRLACIESLIFDLPQRLFRGDHAAFYETLGLEADISRWLCRFRNRACMTPLRWDLVPTREGWKLVEINAGVCMGGMNFELIQGVYTQMRDADQKIVPPQWPSSLQALIDFLVRCNRDCQTGACVALLEDDDVFECYGFFLDSLVRYFTAHSPWQIVSGKVSSLAKKKDAIYLHGKPVDAVLGMFCARDMFRHPARYRTLTEGLTSGTIDSLLHPAAETVYGNKAILALLWQLVSCASTSDEQREALLAVLPETHAMSRYTPASLSQIQDAVVIKPCEGYGGEGVICGWEHSAQSFQRICQARLSNGTNYVVQRRVEVHAFPMQVSMASGESIDAQGRPVIGLITLGGKATAGIVRSFFRPHANAVVNVHNGAAVGPAAF